MARNQIMLPPTESFFRWDNINEIKNDPKYNKLDYTTIKDYMSNNPDITNLISTAAGCVLFNSNGEVEKIDGVPSSWANLKDDKILNFGITPKGALTISISNLIYPTIVSPKPSINLPIICKRYWEPYVPGVPRGTYWNWGNLYKLYVYLKTNLCIPADEFALILNMYIIGAV